MRPGREGRLGESDDGRCNDAHTHRKRSTGLLSPPVPARSCWVNPATVWRARAQTEVLL